MTKFPILPPLIAHFFAALSLADLCRSFSPLHLSLVFFYQQRQG
jgi:hypothetical protein